MIAIGQWGAAAMKLSADARDSLSLILVVGLLFAFISFGHRFLPDDRHALWKNIYFWSSDTESSDSVFFALFVMVANAVNNAAGRPPRSGLAGLVLIAGLTGILVISGLFASRLPRIGALDSVMAAIFGLTAASFLTNGAPVQVWRDLFARGLDYAGRFFPLAGTMVCVLMLGFWVWELDQRWRAHNYACIVDLACFSLGAAAALVGGKRRLAAPKLVMT